MPSEKGNSRPVDLTKLSFAIPAVTLLALVFGLWQGFTLVHEYTDAQKSIIRRLDQIQEDVRVIKTQMCEVHPTTCIQYVRSKSSS